MASCSRGGGCTDSVSLVEHFYCNQTASEESEACFVLSLREAVAHFARARRNWRSTKTEVVGSSDDGDARTGTGTGIDKSTNVGVRVSPLPLLKSSGSISLLLRYRQLS